MALRLLGRKSYTSFEQALREVLRLADIKGIKISRKEEDLIGFVSRASRVKREEILREIAEILDIEFCERLGEPNLFCSKRLGIDENAFARASALPQEIHGLPVLIVADPFVIDREAFEEQGVRVSLGDSLRIEDAWNEYFVTRTRGKNSSSVKECNVNRCIESKSEFSAKQSCYRAVGFEKLALEYSYYTKSLRTNFSKENGVAPQSQKSKSVDRIELLLG